MSSIAIEKNNQPVHVSKAGRHRLYSNEQRKDRNRQAQAAFRDRRSKYQKTLEAAMLKYEDTIEELKRENLKSTERATEAEQRCSTLDAEVADLRKSLQLALAENQRILSTIATPGSPSYSVPEINSPPPSVITSVIPNYDFLFDSPQGLQDTTTTTATNTAFGAPWLPYNIDHKYVFTDCNSDEFCLDFLQDQALLSSQ